MTFSQPWALAAASVPLLLLVLALVRPRPRAVLVGSLTLWDRALARAGAMRQPTESVPFAVILGLIGSLALTIAWSGPRWSGADATARSVRVVLDRSASMRSLRADGRTRWEHARARCAAFLRSLADDDRVELLVVPDADLGPAFALGRPSELAARIDSLAASTAEADWTAALRSRAMKPGSTVVFTSSPPIEPIEGVRVEVVGGRADNLGVSHIAAVELPDGRRQIMVEVRNPGSMDLTGAVALFAGTTPLPEAAQEAGVNGPLRVAVPAGKAARRWWTGKLPAAARSIRAELKIDDARADDNTRSIPLVAGPRLRVAVVGAAEPNIDRLLAAHPRVTRVATPAEADAVIANAAAAPAGFTGHVVLVNPPAGAGIEPGPVVEKCVLTRVAPDADTVFRHGDLLELPIRKLAALAPAGVLNQRATAWAAADGGGEASTQARLIAAATWENPPARRWVALGFSCDRENVPTDSSGRWAHRGLVVFCGRLLDSFIEPERDGDSTGKSSTTAGPDAGALAVDDRPLDTAALIAALPRDSETPPRELSMWAAAAGLALLAAGWAAGRG